MPLLSDHTQRHFAQTLNRKQVAMSWAVHNGEGKGVNPRQKGLVWSPLAAELNASLGLHSWEMSVGTLGVSMAPGM